MQIKLYLDEDVQTAVAEALREKGFDVIATEEVNRKSSPDDEQLKYAIQAERTIVSYNRGHYARLHYEYQCQQQNHLGIIVSTQFSIETTVNCLIKLMSKYSAEEMINRLEYLSSWRKK